jgi:hypothetical protein
MRLDQFLPSPRLLGTAAFVAALPWAPASAADFTISGASGTAQTLGTAAGQTGNLTAAGVLTVTGSSNAVTFSGNNATLNNLGTIKQTGSGRVLRDNTGVTGLTVNNGSSTSGTALMQTANADVFQMNVASGSVLLNNYGNMVSLNSSAGGAQVVDFTAILTGANSVNNFASGSMTAYEADALRPGVNGVVNNWGLIRSITASGSGSDGIDAQTNSGLLLNNYAGATIEGGRHGITGGALDATASFTAVVNNAAGGVVRGNNGAGLNFDGFNSRQLVTVSNAGSIIGNGISGDGDGVDVDGVVRISNSGIIRSLNSFSAVAAGPAYSEGISVGGGSITNSGTIEGLVANGNTNAFGRGITLTGNDISGAPAGTREGLYANAVVTNLAGGLIRGQNDSAIVASGAASGFSVTIDNRAGATIRGGSSSAAAILSGKDDTHISNAGTIDGSSSGKAIEMGSGNNTLVITGGVASVLGSIHGGVGGTNTLSLNPGSGNRFAYDGAISNFNRVEVQGGNVSFSGLSSYAGATRLSGGTLTLEGANRLSASSALELNGGTLKISNAAGAIAQTFASLALGENSSIDLGQSVLVFNSLGSVASGKTLSVLNAGATGYAFQLLGNYAGNADFGRLMAGTTVNGMAATYRFDGTYTGVAAVPEPETYAMLLAGLGLMGTIVRRRRRHAA